MKHLIHIVETATGKVETTLTASSERAADRMEDGVLINLNHDAFHTTREEIEENES